MSKNTVVLALVDKAWPPEHSFVDGMLATLLPKEDDIHVRLMLARPGEGSSSVRRHLNATCLPTLFRRRGIGRFGNLPLSCLLLNYQISRLRKRGQRIVLFVRNDPIYLIAASILRHKVDKLVFQSSHPHERYSGGVLKRAIARLFYGISSSRVDGLMAVSPLGLERLRKLFPGAREEMFIPLLADLPRCAGRALAATHRGDAAPVFIYVGNHRTTRPLEIVLQGIADAVATGAKAKFRFIGAEREDIDRLSHDPRIAYLVKRGVVEFLARIPRHEISGALADADIGLSLLPVNGRTREMSPTKLAEYMGAGLAILATKGVPMQEKFVSESGGGILCEWGVNSISCAIIKLTADSRSVEYMKECAYTYAKKHLQYSNYTRSFVKLLG